jgi:hypothetical protein
MMRATAPVQSSPVQPARQTDRALSWFWRAQLPGSERVLKALSHACNADRNNVLTDVMHRAGVHAALMKFEEPELLDDLLDHWGATPHLEVQR